MGGHQYPPGFYVGIQDSLVSVEPIITNKCPHYKETSWTENCPVDPVGIWNRWVATNIHLYQSSPLGRNGLHCVECPGKRGNGFMNLNLGDLHSLLDKLCFLVLGRLSRTCCLRGWICSTKLLSLGLVRNYVGTIVGEEKIPTFSSSIEFCWI